MRLALGGSHARRRGARSRCRGRRRRSCAGAGPYWPTQTLAISGGTAWVACKEESRLVRMSLPSGRFAREAGRGSPIAVVAGLGAVWALDTGGVVSRIDARTARVTGRIPTGSGAPYNLWVGAARSGRSTTARRGRPHRSGAAQGGRPHPGRRRRRRPRLPGRARVGDQSPRPRPRRDRHGDERPRRDHKRSRRRAGADGDGWRRRCGSPDAAPTWCGSTRRRAPCRRRSRSAPAASTSSPRGLALGAGAECGRRPPRLSDDGGAEAGRPGHREGHDARAHGRRIDVHGLVPYRPASCSPTTPAGGCTRCRASPAAGGASSSASAASSTRAGVRVTPSSASSPRAAARP